MSSTTILPSHRTEVEKAIDRLFAKRVEKLLSTNLSILPKNCLSELIPLLEYIYSADDRDEEEQLTLAERRALLSNILEIHRYSGTVYAIEQVLKALFESAKLIEYKGYIFDVIVHYNDKEVLTESYFNKAKRLINKAKNARSHLRSLKVTPMIRETKIAVISATRLSIKGEINNWNNI